MGNWRVALRKSGRFVPYQETISSNGSSASRRGGYASIPVARIDLTRLAKRTSGTFCPAVQTSV